MTSTMARHVVCLLFAFAVLTSAICNEEESSTMLRNNWRVKRREVTCIEKMAINLVASGISTCLVSSLPGYDTSCDCIPDTNENANFSSAQYTACMDYIDGMTGYLTKYYELLDECKEEQPAGDCRDTITNISRSLQEFGRNYNLTRNNNQQTNTDSWSNMTCNDGVVTYTPIPRTNLSLRCENDEDANSLTVLAMSLYKWSIKMRRSYTKLIGHDDENEINCNIPNRITCSTGSGREERSDPASSRSEMDTHDEEEDEEEDDEGEEEEAREEMTSEKKKKSKKSKSKKQRQKERQRMKKQQKRQRKAEKKQQRKEEKKRQRAEEKRERQEAKREAKRLEKEARGRQKKR